MTDAPEKKLILLDGMAMVYRAHFAMIRNPMINSKGMNTSAVFGYLNILQDILNRWEPTHIAVAFDTPEPTFRHEVFPEYKANRDAMPEDLSQALPYVFSITEALNLPVLRYPGHEADDVLGTLSRVAEERGIPTYIVTPDKDLAQLVTDTVHLLRTGRDGVKEMGVPEVLAEWKIERTEQIIDYLGMAGDSSDNIPGIPGVGPKTAQKLIADYGDLEGVLANADALKGKLKERVIENADLARLSRKLVTIDCNVELEHDIDDFIRREPDVEAAMPLFAELELNTLSKRLLGEGIAAEQEASMKTLRDVDHDYVIVQSDADVDALIEKLTAADAFCFDLETTSLEPAEARLVGMGFGFEPGTAYYVPYPDDLLSIMLLDRFKPVFENPKSTKIGQNLKYDVSVLRNYSIRVQGPFWDTMLAHYVIDPEAGHGMNDLASVYLNYSPITFSSITDGDDLFADAVDVGVMGEYCCEDVDVTLRLKEAFEPLLKEKNAQRVFELECSLISILVDMQQTGIRFDADSLTQFGKDLSAELNQLQDEIWESAGEKFNINSGKQLGIILFEKLKLEEKAKKTRTGQYKTDEQTLVRLAPRHDVVEKILRFKSLEKLNNTYVQKLPGFVSDKDGRIHTHFNQAVTSTGRIASDRPNLQNIPVRTSDGRELRKAFVASGPDYQLLSADYSQIELRIIAEFSKSTHLIEAFKGGEDVHETTAALVFGVPRDEVTTAMRSKSKMVNYGIAYGLSAFGLSQRLNIPRREAADVIDQYFSAFPEIKSYVEETIAFAQENGYVETLTGRRRYLPDVNSRNGTVRQGAERNAVNMPVQGTSADMIKIAMVRIAKAIDDAGLQSKMLLQIHDELLFDVHKDEIDALKEIVVDGMVNALDLSVPVEVNVGLGDNWLEAH